MKNKLKVERAIKDLTQEELANALQVSRQAINAIELNRYIPSLELGMRIAKFFNKPVDEIFMLEEE